MFKLGDLEKSIFGEREIIRIFQCHAVEKKLYWNRNVCKNEVRTYRELTPHWRICAHPNNNITWNIMSISIMYTPQRSIKKYNFTAKLRTNNSNKVQKWLEINMAE